MKTLHESLLYLGYLTGTLHQPEQRAQMLALLRSEEGNITTGWLIVLRDAISEVLRGAGREREHAPHVPLPISTVIAIRDAMLPSQGKAFDCVAFAYAIQSAIDHPNEEGDF